MERHELEHRHQRGAGELTGVTILSNGTAVAVGAVGIESNATAAAPESVLPCRPALFPRRPAVSRRSAVMRRGGPDEPERRHQSEPRRRRHPRGCDNPEQWDRPGGRHSRKRQLDLRDQDQKTLRAELIPPASGKAVLMIVGRLCRNTTARRLSISAFESDHVREESTRYRASRRKIVTWSSRLGSDYYRSSIASMT